MGPSAPRSSPSRGSAGLSLGYFINSGNEADVDFGDLLAHVLEDSRIRVVAGYIEGLRDGRKLLAAADHALALGKPIALAKVARSGAGARAAASHTGSLAGTDRVYTGVFHQAGIVRARNDEHLLDLAAAFTSCPLPSGGGVGLVTQSGGAGVLMADRCEELGLAVPELTEATREALRKVVPAFGAVRNPVDITAQFIAEPALLSKSLELVLADPRVDVAIFYLGLMERAALKIAEDLTRVAKASPKPQLVAWAGAPDAGLRALREGGACVLPSATRAVDAVHGLVQFAERRRRHEREHRTAPASLRGALDVAPVRRGLVPRRRIGVEDRRVLGAEEALALLADYGIAAPRARLARTADEAARFAEELGGALALKADSPAIPHKTEAGEVSLDVRGAEEARAAFAAIVANVQRHDPGATLDGVLVQEMVTGGTEMVVGLHQDPQFGPLVMVGLGGIFVEVLEDVAFGAVPLTRGDAEEMLASLRGNRILDGVRGRPRADRRALVDVLLAVSRLGADTGDAIAELDLNPVVVLSEGRGAVALDALVVLPSREEKS